MQTSEAQKPRLAPPQPGSDHPPQVPRLADCSLKGVSAKFTDRWGSDVGINPATREHEGRTIEPLPVGQHEVSPGLVTMISLPSNLTSMSMLKRITQRREQFRAAISCPCICRQAAFEIRASTCLRLPGETAIEKTGLRCVSPVRQGAHVQQYRYYAVQAGHRHDR